MELMKTDQRQAMIHAFFSERLRFGNLRSFIGVEHARCNPSGSSVRPPWGQHRHGARCCSFKRCADRDEGLTPQRARRGPLQAIFLGALKRGKFHPNEIRMR